MPISALLFQTCGPSDPSGTSKTMLLISIAVVVKQTEERLHISLMSHAATPFTNLF